jgi:hypothetical protein
MSVQIMKARDFACPLKPPTLLIQPKDGATERSCSFRQWAGTAEIVVVVLPS